jgi:hypothetical protein
MQRLGTRHWSTLAALGVAACVGTVGDEGSSGIAAGPGAAGANGSDGGSSVSASCKPNASLVGARLYLISDDQYRNIVRDVFGVTFPATVDVTAPPSGSGNYPYNESAQLETTTVQAYLRAADQVVALMSSFPPCTASVDASCMEQFLRAHLPLAWRRPVTDAEIAGLMAIFNSAATDGQTRQVQITMEAALIHPAFLYRSEIGTGAATATGKVSLTPYELASSVSFALLNSSPDAALWATALDGSILQPSILAAQVTRLMALPAVQANLQKKVSYYLNFEVVPFVSKDPTAYPVFAALRDTLYQSSQLLVKDIVWNGHFADLFTTRRIYANEGMATAYGLPPVSGTTLQPVTTTGDAYSAGVLTQPALLLSSNKNAIGDDVVHRGLWVYYNLLCAPTLPPPPPNAGAVAKTMTGSTRQIAMQRDNGCGAACHGRFDPFGLATLSYDGIGRYRTADPTTTPPGGPIDDSASILPGVLQGMPDMPITVHGVDDLARIFTSGRQVSDCAVLNLATYTLDHSPDVEGSCGLQVIKDSFLKNGSFSELFSSIITSPAFLTRDL